MVRAHRFLFPAATLLLLAACDVGDGGADKDDPQPQARCGNGLIEGGEACDDGNDVATDACTTGCKLAACGDGILFVGFEECDDANDVDTDACTATCKAARCGDGIVQAGVEACDDGNQDDADGCTSACESTTCGNGEVEGHEVCDDGNDVDTDACRNGCIAAACGDGVVWADEEACDDGEDNSDSAPDACRSDCTVARCGDGVRDAGEACDDANEIETDGCTSACEASEPFCGNGVVEGDEVCDDGNDIEADGCTSTCEASLPEGCGNGVVEGDEACDDGNNIETDDCLSTCEEASCGDSVIQAGVETCDDGNLQDGDGCSAACAIEAEPLADPDHGVYKSGTMPADAPTQPADCGGSTWERPYVTYRFANFSAAERTVSISGADATVLIYRGSHHPADPAANCEFAHFLYFDSPTERFVVAPGELITIGVQASVGTQWWMSVKSHAACGDGYVSDIEGCDDGNRADGDGCSSICTVEANYTCPGGTACTPSVCGDELVGNGESCDDGNTMAGDGCSDTCQAEGVECVDVPTLPIRSDGTVWLRSTVEGADATSHLSCDISGTGVDRTYAFISPSHARWTFTVAETEWNAALAVRRDCAKRETDIACASTSASGETVSVTLRPDETVYIHVDSASSWPTPAAFTLTASSIPIRAIGASCSATAPCSAGATCTGGSCVSTCGNGVLDANGYETCDDGNVLPGDGCSATCGIEPGAVCPAAAAACRQIACGDGFLDDGEICDDGNTLNGDGCSSACVPEGETCDDPWVIQPAADGSFSLNLTAKSDNDVHVSCGTRTGADRVLSFTAPFSGRWIINLDSTDFNGALAVQSTCGVHTATLACSASYSSTHTVEVDLTANQTVFVVVEGMGGYGINTFTLAGTFVPLVGTGASCDPTGATNACVFGARCSGGSCVATVCGNGTVEMEGGETCDDGNVQGGDGCGPACKADGIDCANAYPLDTTTSWSTSNWNLGNAVELSCGAVGVRDAVARFKAPTTGRYAFTATAGFDAVVGVLDATCGGTELACERDEVIVDLAAGQAVSVVVDGGYDSSDYGSFTLSVTEVICGNGITEPTESCDDGNAVDGDTCTNACELNGDTCTLAVDLRSVDTSAAAASFAASGNLAGFGGDIMPSCYGYYPFHSSSDVVFRLDGNGTTGEHWSLMLSGASGVTEELVLDVTTACNVRNTRVACVADANAATPRTVDFYLDAHDTVFVSVHAESALIGLAWNLTGTVLPLVAPSQSCDPTGATDRCSFGSECVGGTCLAAVCGNDLLESGEECDDGNVVDGDGCSAFCYREGDSCNAPLDLNGVDQDPAPDVWTYEIDMSELSPTYQGACGATGGRNDATFIFTAPVHARYRTSSLGVHYLWDQCPEAGEEDRMCTWGTASDIVLQAGETIFINMDPDGSEQGGPNGTRTLTVKAFSPGT